MWNTQSEKQRYLTVIIILVICLVYYLYKECESSNNDCRSMLDKHDSERRISKHRVVNKVLTDYDAEIAERFQWAVDLKMEPSDQRLQSLILEMMDAPSKHLLKVSKAQKHTPQSQYISNLLKKSNGFFIECGAMDGETSSNSIMLEFEKKWTGLLIEPDPYMYTQLLGKNRHAWSINACLSSSRYPQWLTFAEDKGQRGMIIDHISKKPDFLEGPEIKVPCFSIESLLSSLNITHVDYFSLDIEGMEKYFLESIENSKLDIQSWTIEYDKIGQALLKKLMQNLGYKSIQKIDHSDSKLMLYAHDLVFVKS